MRLTRWLAHSLLALAAGLAQAWAIADPWTGQPHGWLQILSLSWLMWRLAQGAGRSASWRASTWVSPERGAAWRRALWPAWLFAVGWLAGTFWWLFISMHTYGGLNAALAAAAVLALAGFLALYYAAAGAAFVALAPARRSSLETQLITGQLMRLRLAITGRSA